MKDSRAIKLFHRRKRINCGGDVLRLSHWDLLRRVLREDLIRADNKTEPERVTCLLYHSQATGLLWELIIDYVRMRHLELI